MGKISAGAAGQHKAGGAVALCDLWHHGICHRSDFVGLPAGAEYADAGNPERFIDDDGAECLFCRGDDSGGVQVGRPKGTADFYAGPGRILNRQVSVVATASFYKMVLLGIAGLFLLLVLGLLLSIHLSVKIVSKKEL